MAESKYILIKVNNLTTIQGLKTKNKIFYQLIDNKDFKYLGNYNEYKSEYYDTDTRAPVPNMNSVYKILKNDKLIFKFNKHNIEIFNNLENKNPLNPNVELNNLNIYYESINKTQQNTNELHNGGRYKNKSSKKHKTSSTKKFRKL